MNGRERRIKQHKNKTTNQSKQKQNTKKENK